MSILYVGIEVFVHDGDGGVESKDATTRMQVEYDTVSADTVITVMEKIKEQLEEEFNLALPPHIKHIYLLDE